MIHHPEDGNKVPKSTEERLTAIYKDMVRKYDTGQMIDILLMPETWTEELVEGVKNKILTLSQN